MILSDAITRLTAFQAFDLDSFNGETPTQVQSITVLNWAMRMVARRLFLFDNNIAWALTAGQADYNLNDTTLFTGPSARAVRILQPFRVMIGGNYLSDPTGCRQGLWTMEQLDSRVTNWRTLANGLPLRAIWHGGTQYLRLNPAPDASTVALGNHFLIAQYAPADMSLVADGTNTDLPKQLPIHEDVHEAVCFLAAYYSAMPNASEQEGWQRLKAYNAEQVSLIEELRMVSVNSQTYAGTDHDVPHREAIWI